jgi:crotonobetainyl-CoA:carnitine CoA-transferase CaiB-like acyl-CoA transferase
MAAVLGGEGDWVDVSIMETFLSSIDRRADSLVAYAYCGEKMRRSTFTSGVEVPPAYNRCADGWFHLSVSERALPQIAAAIGRPVEELAGSWAGWCTARGKREIVAQLQAAGVPAAPVNSVADVVDDPQLAERGFFATVEHPEHGPLRHAGLPFRFADTPGAVALPAPRLGEHNEAVFGPLGYPLYALARAGAI